jgi:hypothetical protein
MRLRSLALACVAFTGFSLALSSTSRATQTRSAAQLLTAALSDANASGSVHQSIVNADGSEDSTFSDDVAVNTGSQNITVSGGISAHVLVVGSSAYISGNETAFVKYFGFPRAVATVIGSRWVQIPSSNADYATVASNATLPSTLAFLTPHGRLTEIAPRKIGGKLLIGIRGDLPPSLKLTGTMTIYISSSSRPLPMFATFTAKQRGATITSTSTMSDWGERVAVKRPPDTIPAAKL